MEQVPAALRVGSPVTAKANNPFSDSNATLESPTNGSQDQVPEPFPGGGSLNSSNRRSRNRYSFSVPAPTGEAQSSETPTLTNPTSPSPPLLSEPRPYRLMHDPSTRSSSLSSYPPPSRHQSLLDKLGSFRSLRPSRAWSKYGRLEDTEDGKVKTGRTQLKDVDEEDDGENIAYDLSDFEGPFALQTMDSKRNGKPVMNLQGLEDVCKPAELGSGYARLGGSGSYRELGGGMGTSIETPGVQETERARTPVSTLTRHFTMQKRNASAGQVQNEAAQRAAEKTGEIVAVTELPVVDISNLDGAEYESRSFLKNVVDQSTKSYYFPPDPDMPAWKPMSMHWWYISVLIVIAVVLGLIQEYLCQISMRGGENGGLLVFKSPQNLSMAEYFGWKYAPTITFLSYGISWQIADFDVKRLEPYYQLSRPTGATAAESLNMDYLTSLSWLIPLRAIRHRHWAVLFSSLATLITGSLLPVLQQQVIVMLPAQEDRKEGENKYVRVVPVWSRIMSASLFFVALCGILLSIKLRRKSGLLSDPQGIAGIAAMATQSHILQDFDGLDIAPKRVIHKQLAHRRYILHKSSLWQGEYIRSNGEEYETQKGDNPVPLMLTLKAGIPYLSAMLLFMVSLPIFLFQPKANLATEKVPFLLTALATVIKLLWGTMTTDVRVLEPFYRLSRRHAPARTLTLDYAGTTPGYLPIKALLNGHYLVALVGAGALMTEILTVCVSSFSVDGKKFFPGKGHSSTAGTGADDTPSSRYNADVTFKSFWVSFALAMGILAYLCGVGAAVYARRRHAFLPRQPGTIAAVLAFIHQSRMLLSFVDTQRMHGARMTRYLEHGGKRYALGWFRGRDGRDHCGIDEEPVVAAYRFGVDWRKSRVQPGQVGTWEVF